MKTRVIVNVIFFLLLSFYGKSQHGSGSEDIFLKKTQASIKIDGVLDESAWYTGSSAKHFWENFPSDSLLAEAQTEVFMTYDDQFLYVGAKCYSDESNYIVSSLKRDYMAGGSDNLTFLFDPFLDNTNAFVFGMNPYGVMREALISNGGNNRDDWSGAWDNKWKGESSIQDGYWACEIAIPFSSIRFNAGEKKWNFNCYRFDTQSNTQSTWQRIPRNQTIMTLAYMGKMNWEDPPSNKSANVSIIPYVTAGIQRDNEAGESDQNFNAGADAKIGITSGLNLDLTINPDFSQVEVDEQVINLSRFEIFFPERRQFFLENSDLFGSFGNSRINPFFSRRIGVDYDPEKEENVQTPILLGGRLSGKIGNDWRVGLLNMQTAKKGSVPPTNFTVTALQRKIFDRSNIGLIFVNKENFTDEKTDTTEFTPYNRVMGFDYNLATADNSWTGKIFYHQAFTSSDENDKFAHGARLEYQKRAYRLSWSHSWVGEGYDAEVGFVPRKGYFSASPEARLYFYGKEGKIDRHGPEVEARFYWEPGQGKVDHSLNLGWGFRLRNKSFFDITVENEYTYLFDDFDPSRSDGTPLPGESEYTYTSLKFFYFSDSRKKLSWRIRSQLGEFYNGEKYTIGGEIGYRIQPIAQIGLDINFNRVILPEPYATANLFLIGPRVDLTFSKNIFLSTFIQYNNQADNVNINTRFQWRFAPVSDFFIVYTDNYTAEDFNNKNRALVAKLSYWFNL